MLRKRLHQFATFTAAAALILTAVAPRPAMAAPKPAPAPQLAPAAAEESDWLVMLYQNADDEVLEGDIFTDLNEAELVGSTDEVTIVSQFDRFDGAFDGDGDWTGAKRFLVTYDDDLSTVNSEELEDLGEVDSGAPETLTDFLIWGITNFPAKKVALILSDHGAGWVGGWNDDAPEEGSTLSVDEIDQALAAAAGRDRRRPPRVHRLRCLPHEPGGSTQRHRTLREIRRRLGGNRTGHGLGLR